MHLSDGERSVLFSGDLDGVNDLLIPPPTPPPSADWIVMESTYGDRDKPDEEWAEVALEDGRVGWVPVGALETT